jgi:glycine/D-amino acid oxidase-like deaminating enzyme
MLILAHMGSGPPPNAAKVERSLAAFKHLLPALKDLSVERSWAICRPERRRATYRKRPYTAWR